MAVAANSWRSFVSPEIVSGISPIGVKLRSLWGMWREKQKRRKSGRGEATTDRSVRLVALRIAAGNSWNVLFIRYLTVEGSL